MATQVVSQNDFQKQVLEASLPVLVDFWAPWCGPCKMAEPALEELSEEFKGKAVIAKVNVDENQSLAEKYNVLSIPTTVLFKNGEEQGRQIGFNGKKAFEELVTKSI